MPKDFLSQITDALGTSGQPGNTVPPRPKPRIRATVTLRVATTVEFDVTEDDLNEGYNAVAAIAKDALPQTFVGQPLLLEDLTVDEDSDVDYDVINQDDIDAWDLAYAHNYNPDGTPIDDDGDDDGDDDDEDDDDDDDGPDQDEGDLETTGYDDHPSKISSLFDEDVEDLWDISDKKYSNEP